MKKMVPPAFLPHTSYLKIAVVCFHMQSFLFPGTLANKDDDSILRLLASHRIFELRKVVKLYFLQYFTLVLVTKLIINQ